MATIVEQAPVIPSRPSTPPPHLSLNTSVRGTPAAVPNKHIPVCSPGRAPRTGLTTPPTSPPSRTNSLSSSYVLHPADAFERACQDPEVYGIKADTVFTALEQYATQPLPDPKLVFPWLHGLHESNAIQLAFFAPRRRADRRPPPGLRGITIVKAGGDLSRSKIKGAISPDELLAPLPPNVEPQTSTFIDADPREGFSVRNFHIQACKMASVSDIIIYGADDSMPEDVLELAQRIAWAQQERRERLAFLGWQCDEFNTFVVQSSFAEIESKCPQIVAIDSHGVPTGHVHDFFMSERHEMASMTKASEIAPNVFLGPSVEPLVSATALEETFDVFIEASEVGHIPESKTLKELQEALDGPQGPTVHFEVSGSGSITPPTWSHSEVDGLLRLCRWMWEVANGIRTPITHYRKDSKATMQRRDDNSTTPGDVADGEVEMGNAEQPTGHTTCESRKILIHCPDGYTESTLLGLTYFMYAHGLSVSEAWTKMHREYNRNFFAYATDVALLSTIQTRILTESPARKTAGPAPALSISTAPEPEWLHKLDGSLPSRILPYMYLGNLTHANNAALLRELGIGRIVSVGERVNGSERAVSRPATITGGAYDGFEFVVVENVQDNGIDSLTGEIEPCLDFIERGKFDGVATLVHCRVGVSRSATICIAEVMKELDIPFPQAYCFVRARRLNVIIQPHLRFIYELLKWEEELNVRRGRVLRRELEWATIAREIAAMNRPYARS